MSQIDASDFSSLKTAVAEKSNDELVSERTAKRIRNGTRMPAPRRRE